MKKRFYLKRRQAIFGILLLACFSINTRGQIILPPLADPDPFLSVDPAGPIAGAFDVSATGGAVYSIPVDIPQGIGGMQPSLAIVYDSQSCNGMLGWGCIWIMWKIHWAII